MPAPIVVGVCHEQEKDLLLDEYSQERFYDEICPLINDRTLLVLEGRYHRTVFTPEHKRYKAHRDLAERIIAVPFPSSPAIAWPDGRMFPKHRAAVDSHYGGIFDKILRRIPRPHLTCRSINELLRRVRRGIAVHAPTRSLSKEEHLLLWANAKEMREFDKRAVRVAKKHCDAYQVIIVCGIVHALAIAQSEGWPLKIFMRDTKKEAHDAIRIYHASYVLPQYFPNEYR